MFASKLCAAAALSSHAIWHTCCWSSPSLSISQSWTSKKICRAASVENLKGMKLCLCYTGSNFRKMLDVCLPFLWRAYARHTLVSSTSLPLIDIISRDTLAAADPPARSFHLHPHCVLEERLRFTSSIVEHALAASIEVGMAAILVKSKKKPRKVGLSESCFPPSNLPGKVRRKLMAQTLVRLVRGYLWSHFSCNPGIRKSTLVPFR